MAKAKGRTRARKAAGKVAEADAAGTPEQKPLVGMEDVRNVELDTAIAEHVKAKARAAKAKQEADGWQDKIGELMKAAETTKYTHNDYTARRSPGKEVVKVKREPKKTTAK